VARLRAEGIDSAEGKQKIIVELYDKFFRNAFPKMSERLGIVYTPVEIVDFILKSVDHLLRTEFGQTLGSEGVHILDPFAGTGTFITRLFQSGFLTKEELARKYKTEFHGAVARATPTRPRPEPSARSADEPRGFCAARSPHGGHRAASGDWLRA